MSDIDIIIIAQSEVVNYDAYSKLPLEKIELYSELVFPRMVYYKGGFRSHLDIINFFQRDKFFGDASYLQRRDLLNIWNLPGMNSLYLANYLLQFGIKTKVIKNFDAEWDMFCEAYEKNKHPPLVGISTTFYLSYAQIRRIIKEIRKCYPETEIVLGGAFVNEQTVNGDVQSFQRPMRKYGINYILHAFSSEADLRDMILNRKENISQDKVYNLAYIEGNDLEAGDFKTTPVRWNEPVLDDLPVLWDKLDISFINRTVQMRASCGCPFSCAFCSYPKTAGKFSLMACRNIERHIQSILKIGRVDKIIFIDDTFNVPLSRFKEMCRLFCKYDFEWFSFLRVQFIDEDTVKLMKDSGCKGVYLGIESADDLVLKNMNKKATRAQFMRGMNLLKKYDIISVAAFVIGFPGETEETVRGNIEFIETSGIDFYTLKEFYYMRHTPIYENREEFGLSGIGNDWKHNTMDYKTAHQKKIDIFKAVKGSIFIDADTSLWYLAYLYDQGYTIKAISKIQREINKIMAEQIDGVFDDNHSGFKELRRMFSKQAVNQ
jgi:p-methyltransferase